jgi:hypothetical protein
MLQLRQISRDQSKAHCRIALFNFQDSADRRSVVRQTAKTEYTLGWISHYAATVQDAGCSLNGLGLDHSLHRPNV